MVYIRITAALFLGLNLCMPMRCHGQNRPKFTQSAWLMGLSKGILGGYLSSAISKSKSSAGIAMTRTERASAMAKIVTLAKAAAKPRVNTRLGWITLLGQQSASVSFTAIVPDPYSLMRTTARRSVSVPAPLLMSE